MDELQPSTLGTKRYWDSHYEKELSNFDDFHDVGDIWFGESSECRIIKYLSDCSTPYESRIIDLGCGNGHLSTRLAKCGYVSVTGIDYSENAINLSRKLAMDEEVLNKLEFVCVDILSMESVCDFTSSRESFDVVIDKGTFDAITLTPDDVDPQRISVKSRDTYLQNTHHLLRPGGRVIITSCNWTSEELKQEFSRTLAGRGQLFQFVCELPSTSIHTFGGVVGATTICHVFECLK